MIDIANRRPRIGPRLAELRKRAGYTSQRAFARAVGVSGGLVAQWEVSTKVPGRKNLLRIADLTGVTIDYILGGDQVRLIAAPKTAFEREQELLRIFRLAPVAFQENLVELLRQSRVIETTVDEECEPA
jgi:transcriptional regulator with XRE-family HTH domain